MRKFLMATSFLFLFILLFIPATSQAQVAIGVSVHIGPPVLPVYAQPPCPMPGYIWTPGYWAWGEDGYYWVPGVWVSPPEAGLLWTPGYWGFVGGEYLWRPGYWGPHVGFYGGINYGFGYGGVGFVGGRWNGGTFVYNTAVTNVNTTVIHNTYVDKTVINNTTIVNNHYSFNGQAGRAVSRARTSLRADVESVLTRAGCAWGPEPIGVREPRPARQRGHGFGERAALQPAGAHREWRCLGPADTRRNPQPREPRGQPEQGNPQRPRRQRRQAHAAGAPASQSAAEQPQQVDLQRQA